MAKELPLNWDENLPVYAEDPKGTATRITSGLMLNFMAKRIPDLMGGSADLAPSNKTWIDGESPFQADTRLGRNFHFGVREHAMGSIVNGMAVYGSLIPYGATFLTFSDYMRPAIRVSALSGYPSIWIFTHDSIGLGEDGPTHQPVEHLAALRAIPNLVVIRPSDANEVVHTWKIAVARRDGPTAMALSRQNLPIIDRNKFSSAKGLDKGAYILADLSDDYPEVILMASGSEVSLIIEAANILVLKGKKVRLVSFPSWELFDKQSTQYKEFVLPKNISKRVAVEAGIEMGWSRWLGDEGEFIGLSSYGKSAPYEILYKEFGLTVDHIVERVMNMLN